MERADLGTNFQVFWTEKLSFQFCNRDEGTRELSAAFAPRSQPISASPRWACSDTDLPRL